MFTNPIHNLELENFRMQQANFQMQQMLNAVMQENYRLGTALQASNMALQMPKPQMPRSIEVDFSTNYYCSRERSGRIVPIGIISIKEVIAINPHNDGTFDFIYVEYNTGGTETYTATIPYDDFVSKRIVKYFPKFQKHIDCPDSLLRDLLYYLVMNAANQKALTIPQHIG